MLDFHEKRKLKGILYSKPTIAGIILLALFLSTAVYERYAREREMAEKRDVLLAELETLQVKASALDAEVVRLKSERGMEEEIRDRFEVSKPGEEVVILLEDGAKKDEAPTTTETPPEPGGFFERLWQ